MKFWAVAAIIVMCATSDGTTGILILIIGIIFAD